MTERRLDPYTGRSVLIAPGRRGVGATRPGGLPAPEGRCPFCPGHEADTEPTVAKWPPDRGGQPAPWEVRVVRNKFPLAQEAGEGVRGVHEVGIDARRHDIDLPDFEVSQLRSMLRLYRDRCAALASEDGIESVVLFRNRGRRAGSSQPHPHTQIVALAHVPAEVELREARARAFLEANGEPLHAQELRRELRSERVLIAEEGAVLVAPRAPTRPYELRILPRAPSVSFARADEISLGAVATLLRDATRRLRSIGITDMNLVFRQPSVAATGPAFGWHLEILPRTGGDAGFEIATGEMIVVVSPEEAARALRDAERS